jgi:protein-disulfide isomerase
VIYFLRMRFAYLTFVGFVVGAGASGSVVAAPMVPMPVLAGLLGVPFPPSAPAAPAHAEAPIPGAAPDRPASDLPASLGPVAAPAPARPNPYPALSPISPGELHALVAPAVVALAVSGTKSLPHIVTGVLVTASGLALTSRRAIADALEKGARISMVHGGPRGRLGARELAEAVPARIVEVSADLDLALVEALPPASVFYPHLPVARRSAPGGAKVLAVGHSETRGLWASATATLAGPTSPGVGRWLREATAVPPDVGLGTPLFDGVGRIVALITEPEAGAPRAIDADALLRFLVAARAPALRFAGVPPFRRPLPPTPQPVLASSGVVAGARAERLEGLGPVARADVEMPRVANKGTLDHWAKDSKIPRSPAPAEAAARGALGGASGTGQVSFDGPLKVVTVAASALASNPLPSTFKLAVDDAPDRGPHGATVTAIELGDYHAPQTRAAESAVRALTDGAGARVRLYWQDADRGDGAGYHLAARAARAAREQDEFWAMHDRLMKGPPAPTEAELRKLARALDLDLKEFDAAFESEGLQAVLEAEADKAAHVPVLATPSFLVNGRLVDGGSVAGSALRAAVDEELASAAAGPQKHLADGIAVGPCREIAAGGPVAGMKLNVAATAKAMATAAVRSADRDRTLESVARPGSSTSSPAAIGRYTIHP